MPRTGWKLTTETKERMRQAARRRYAEPPDADELLARIEAKTTKTVGGCWEWQGKRSRGGYGKIKIRNKEKYVHRVAWEILKGAIPEGQLLRHRVCDNPACWRPAHLKPGTQRENMRDKSEHGRHANTRKTHCAHGHAFTKANTYIDPRGRRNCLTCRRRIDRERRKQRKEIN
ncbi:MAG TPA: HNH endonuclease signature motif containing protein [Pyrinomonadaceae bacterium]|nr:HNH endonuclease signature motif containing protein [Pyrinomonadaceae bacterium]